VNEVTRFFKSAINTRINDVLKEVPAWSIDDLKYRQGYLQALSDMNPQELTVEGIE
jgi:hypothetical protein